MYRHWNVYRFRFVLAVTIERLVAIRFPLRAKYFWTKFRLVLVIVILAVLSNALTSYHHFAYENQRFQLCNNTQVFYQRMPVTKLVVNVTNNQTGQREQRPTYPALKIYVQASTITCSVLVVAIPLVALIALNICLVLTLQVQQRSISRISQFAKSDYSERQQANERKVTRTVAVIVLSFTVFNGPSMVLSLWNLANDFQGPPEFYTAASISNSLVITGKILNFFLYCVSSSHFRQCLKRMFQNSNIGQYITSMSTNSSITVLNRVAYGPNVRKLTEVKMAEMRRIPTADLILNAHLEQTADADPVEHYKQLERSTMLQRQQSRKGGRYSMDVLL